MKPMNRPFRRIIVVAFFSLLVAAPAWAQQPSWSADASACNELLGEPSLQACNRALQWMTDSDSDSARIEIYLSRGILLGRFNRSQEALAMFDKAIELDPTNAKAHYNRGVALEALHNKRKALAAYREATELDPSFIEAWGNRGVIAFDRGYYAEAANSLTNASELNPAYFDTHPQQRKAWDVAVSMKPASTRFGHEMGLRVSPGIAYIVPQNLRLDEFDYILVDTEFNAQIWGRFFGTAGFLFTTTPYKSPINADFDIYGITAGLKYVLFASQYETHDPELFLDKCRYWFGLGVGPYITRDGGSRGTGTGNRTKIDIGGNVSTGFDYYVHPNIGVGFQVKAHLVAYDDLYFIISGGPALIGRF